ncbi:hypothetical protein HMPREF9248_0357 [Fannyhessea vaginae PB189-T1-4]|uniref:Uncharacterized protein n=1 Tax=Fannyhessea vaginae PB189-T1-4 TaxID=866774 RepID=A0ABP2J1N1_9ACTN|nr:hypothetical protein HMPREF9248_0357 [Fannyhessea vaginae PB189-T1-4]
MWLRIIACHRCTHVLVCAHVCKPARNRAYKYIRYARYVRRALRYMRCVCTL